VHASIPKTWYLLTADGLGATPPLMAPFRRSRPSK
jgi:hypothetical protein